MCRRGGEEVLLEMAGQDATEPYDELGHSENADKMLLRYYIGELQEQVSVLSQAQSLSLLLPGEKLTLSGKHRQMLLKQALQP